MNFVISQTFGRSPTQDEIDGIMEQVNLFYFDVLSNTFSDFESFVATESSSNSDVAGSFTITMLAYTADTAFVEGAALPSQAEVDAAIQGADLNTFVQNYIPNATPTGTIFGTTVMASSASNT